VLALAGCAGGSKAPEPVFYLLRADVNLPDGAENPPVRIGINRVSVADYLGEAGIVVGTSGGQVRAARQHLWAEPLDASIRLYLRDVISAELGYPVSADTGRRQAWEYRVDVHIDRWHGSLDGNVRLQASWALIDNAADDELARYRLEREGVLASDGYDALVRAQTGLLDELARAMAASVRDKIDE
jgi:uncharacterized lipoprotein YmbA